jgi:hypothetical protein
MTDPSDVAGVAGKLTADDLYVLMRGGLAFGRTPFSASVMRPLERRGLFTREARPGFQVRWHVSQLGLAVRDFLSTGADHDRSAPPAL